MDDWMLWLPFGGLIAIISIFHFWMRSVARRESERMIRGYIVSHVLQPRNANGQFKRRNS